MVLAELQGVSWELVCGSKHWQLRINGRFVGILPHHAVERNNCNELALRCQVRRFRRETCPRPS